jgi:hypothetical protein
MPDVGSSGRRGGGRAVESRRTAGQRAAAGGGRALQCRSSRVGALGGWLVMTVKREVVGDSGAWALGSLRSVAACGPEGENDWAVAG